MMKKRAFIILLAVVIIILMILSLMKVIDDTLGMSIAFLLFVVFAIIIGLFARKSEVKIIEYLMYVFAVIALILFGVNLKAYLKLTSTSDYKFQVIVDKSKSEKALMFEYGDRKYYTYNLSKVSVIMDKDGKTYSLKEALESNLITLDEILELAIPNEGTTGYKIYYDGGQKKYQNDEYSIVVCETGKKDVIFSTFDYVYNENICK